MLCVAGKRAGTRRGPKQGGGVNRSALPLAAGITLCVIAWGYLVFAAIDFGTSARAGECAAWALLVLASLGAVACLFAGLLLVAKLMRALKGSSASPADAPPREPGGRRAAR
jgi:hypothetical protein